MAVGIVSWRQGHTARNRTDVETRNREKDREERRSVPAIQGPANTEFEFVVDPGGTVNRELEESKVPQTERFPFSPGPTDPTTAR